MKPPEDKPLAPEILQALGRLEHLDARTLDVAKRLMRVGGGLYPLDLLAVAAMNRSLCLISGFRKLIASKNFISAAPLLRLQIDNCLRFFAAELAPSTDDFSLAVLRGEEVRRIKSRDGKKMTDAHLVEKLSENYPWIPSVYRATSGYVHLSDRHMFAAMRTVDKESRQIGMVVMREDRFVPDELYLECVEAFEAATMALLDLLESWHEAKAESAGRVG